MCKYKSFEKKNKNKNINVQNILRSKDSVRHSWGNCWVWLLQKIGNNFLYIYL